MENSPPFPVVPVLMAIVLMGAVAVVVWVTHDDRRVDVEATAETSSQTVVEGLRRGDAIERPPADASRSETLVNRAPAENEEWGEAEGEDGVGVVTTTGTQGLSDVSRETLESWKDNPDVRIGPNSWMPRVAPEEDAIITRTLDAPMPPKMVWLNVRRESIDSFKRHAVECFANLVAKDPQARGRAIVVWEIEGNGVVATASQIRLGPVVDLVDPQFLECLLATPFPQWSSPERFGRVVVEYALMLP